MAKMTEDDIGEEIDRTTTAIDNSRPMDPAKAGRDEAREYLRGVIAYCSDMIAAMDADDRLEG